MRSIQEIDAHTLVEWLQDNNRSFRLIDVRSDGEFAQGMIPKGEPLPLHLLPLRAPEIDQNTEVVFYCRTGARSAQACMFLAGRGHTNVFNLRGGIMDWARKGLPLMSAVA
jgi:rhodanese-related sulfurtransferase